MIEPELVEWLLGRIEQYGFAPFAHGEAIGVDSNLADTVAVALLNLVANDHRLFRIVREITGCGPIGCFRGRVYRMLPNAGHYDSWHNDLGDERLITLSVNLSPEPYSGGILQIRHRPSNRIVYEVANTGLGDAILFRISPDLEHRVTEVTGSVPKTAFAGWFRSKPDFRELLVKSRTIAAAGSAESAAPAATTAKLS